MCKFNWFRFNRSVKHKIEWFFCVLNKRIKLRYFFSSSAFLAVTLYSTLRSVCSKPDELYMCVTRVCTVVDFLNSLALFVQFSVCACLGCLCLREHVYFNANIYYKTIDTFLVILKLTLDTMCATKCGEFYVIRRIYRSINWEVYWSISKLKIHFLVFFNFIQSTKVFISFVWIEIAYTLNIRLTHLTRRVSLLWRLTADLSIPLNDVKLCLLRYFIYTITVCAFFPIRSYARRRVAERKRNHLLVF